MNKKFIAFSDKIASKKKPTFSNTIMGVLCRTLGQSLFSAGYIDSSKLFLNKALGYDPENCRVIF